MSDVPASAPPVRTESNLRWLPLAAAAWFLVYWFLQPASRWIVHSVLSFSPDNHFGNALEFFLYETPKVLLLLTIVVFAVGIIRTFFSPERTRRLLAGRREAVGNVMAAFLGTVTPFCSCSAVPLFIGFVEAGVPLGVTLSFLIAAPLVNEVALVLLLGMFGWRVALAYLLTGLSIAIVAGWVIGRLRMDRHVEPWVFEVHTGKASTSPETNSFGERVRIAAVSVKEIVGKVWPYVVVGIAIGAGIHGYVPTNALASLMGKEAWWSIPVAVVIGVPMYSNAAGIVPVLGALLSKGASLGAALAFMMAVIGLSLPEVIILRKVLRPRLIATFVAVVATGILVVGYVFNLLF